VRAIVGPRYVALDDDYALATLQTCLAALDATSGARAVAVATGPVTVLRVILPSSSLVSDHHMYLGLDYTNGELGNRALSITPSIYSPTLGSARGVASRTLHVGDPLRLRDAFSGAVPQSLSDAHELLGDLRREIDRQITSPTDELAALVNYGATVAEARDTVRVLAAQRDVTLPEQSRLF